MVATFLWAVGVPWDRATRIEAGDFCRWMLVGGKPRRPHWRRQGGLVERRSTVEGYAASVRAHCETVLRCFYEFHLGVDDGPLLVNPFPLSSSRRGGRAHAHYNPMEPFAKERTGLYRPRVPRRVPRSIPDEEFNEIFALLPSHRDRALVAFCVSTGARASELLSTTQGGVDPGRHLISVGQGDRGGPGACSVHRRRWHTGAADELVVERRGPGRTPPEALAIVRQYGATHSNVQIATVLNDAGLRTGKSLRFTPRHVAAVRGIYRIFTPRTMAVQDGEISVKQAAQILGIPADAIYNWLRQGQVPADSRAGRWCIPWDPEIQAIYRQKVTNSLRLRLRPPLVKNAPDVH